MPLPSDAFGCEHCLPSDADDAWESVSLLKIDSALVEESHFTVKLRSCRACGQNFISVFTETIDWADGEDPQFWSVLPITPTELSQLSTVGAGLITKLNGLAPDRRSLRHDFPKGASPKSFWSTGITIGPHD